MDLPFISVLVPCLNEEEFIADCLLSILTGTYSLERIEVLVIDGGSTDSTIQIVEDIQSRFGQITILENPRKIVPAALNLGVKTASYENIVWVGAHAIYDRDYLKNLLSCFIEGNVSSVGGIIIPKGRSTFGKAVALATKNKFGIGNAKYRYAKKRQIVDTVFGGCWLKSSIEKIGGFNEEWVRNQDYELNTRLQKYVAPIILDPNIKCYYFCRESLLGLIKQYFQYGFWRFKTLTEHPSTLNIRVLAPVALLIGFVVSLLVLPFNISLGLFFPLIYFSICLLIALVTAFSNKKFSALVLLPIIFPSIHISWACGFFKSAWEYINKK